MHEHGMWRRNMWMKVIASNINPRQWRLKSFSLQLSNMFTMLNSALLRLFQKMLYLSALAQPRSWLFSHLHFFISLQRCYRFVWNKQMWVRLCNPTMSKHIKTRIKRVRCQNAANWNIPWPDPSKHSGFGGVRSGYTWQPNPFGVRLAPAQTGIRKTYNRLSLSYSFSQLHCCLFPCSKSMYEVMMCQSRRCFEKSQLCM